MFEQSFDQVEVDEVVVFFDFEVGLQWVVEQCEVVDGVECFVVYWFVGEVQGGVYWFGFVEDDVVVFVIVEVEVVFLYCFDVFYYCEGVC